ncbi:MAG: PLP-dependent aminotransferase family protein [Rubrivivax sp.]|nr:PLP-dependent aminotransferase family protein [Rubrivivax sp.]
MGLAEQLAQRVAESIRLRVLPPGARLPSVRVAAQRHGVSPATVVSAYDRLQAQGHIEARAQRGFFVREPRPPATPARHAPPVREASGAPVDAAALLRGMFAHPQSPLSPGIGMLPQAWLDAPLLQRALRQCSGPQQAAGWLGYGEPAGDPTLRAALARRLADLGVGCSSSQIITTVGATHALDIIARTLLQPGDAVLVDEPGWAIEFARLQRLGLRLLPVPRGEQGPDLGVMESLCRAHRPRAYVTVSVLHNPTGGSLSAAAAHRVLQLAQEHDLTLVEDDSYAWLAPPHALRLSALDGLQRSILVSGFSKILTPQWRIGFMAAPPALVERLTDTKLLSSLTSPALLEQAVAWCLDQGLLRRHAERVIERLDAARVRSVRQAEAAGCRFVTPPRGLFGWVEAGVDTDRLALAMHEQGWLLAPGSLFLAQRRPSSLMRLNFASTLDDRFWRLFAGMRATL